MRWLADFVLQLFSLTGFLGWWSDLPQFHPGLSALWYFWRLWKCKKGWLLFFYNFPPFHCFMFFCVPAVAATNMPLRSLVVRTSDGRPGERILNSPSPLDRDHTSHRLPAGIWNKPNSVRNRFPLKGDLSSRTPPPLPISLADRHPCRTALRSKTSFCHICTKVWGTSQAPPIPVLLSPTGIFPNK